ncbi:MAG: NCS2 family permease [Geodermatophilaceae bacterium]|nr:NCS2 family permease [Geodermatophilaceae bacterium]
MEADDESDDDSDDIDDESDGDIDDDIAEDGEVTAEVDEGVAAVAPRRRLPSVRRSRGAATATLVAPVEAKTGPRVNTGPKIRPKSGLDAYFEVSQRRSTYGREVRGGVVTFFTMAYILVLNPIILSGADVDGTTLPFAGVAATTAMVAGVMTILMGIVGRYPFALATGLGLNALVAVLAVTQMSWPEIMGLVVLEGLLITILVVTGLRTAIFAAIPQQLKIAISVGIGLFLTLIGLVDAGFVKRVPDAANTVVPVQLGSGFNLDGWPVLVFALGVLIMSVLVVRKVRGGILIGIITTTVIAIIVEAVAKVGPAFSPDGGNPNGWQLTVPTLPDSLVATPDLSLVGNFSLFGGFDRIGTLAALLIVFTLLLADFFDTMGTVVAVGAEGNLLDKNDNLPGATRVLFVDSVAAAAGGASSVSSNTTYIESASGVADGARTGIASVVTGVLFLVAMFLSPLVSIVPSEAAAPALVVVGALLVSQIRNLKFDDLSLVIPAFLTMALMPFTFSITNGIGAGFISFVVLRLAKGRGKDVHPLMWVSALLFTIYFFIDPIKQLIG